MYLLYDGFFNLVVVNGINLRQLVTPPHLQSRVNTTARMIAWGGQPFGAAIGGVVAEYLPIRGAFLVVALGVGIGALLAWFTPLRERVSLRALRTPESGVSG
jgi:hypothetical protein